MLRIAFEGNHPTIEYASAELKRCLELITRQPVDVGKSGSEPSIRVGLFSEFDTIDAPAVADALVDDAIYVDVADGAGIISGVNPRSVLLGAYRYLAELGCRWVRPGADGEYIPRLDVLPAVKLKEMPSYRHRGICIEGAVSLEHVINTIEWMPRVGFNGYFIQFREAYTFFDRWYSHKSNPFLEGVTITVDQAREFTAKAVAEIKKRDMLYHAVGHGWTCEPFGISGLGWERNDSPLPENVTKYLAEVNGKRELWGGIALNTNLCYGNPEARRIVVEEIANYVQAHPEIDILHFWLADGSNNQCECELCRDTRPADFYVMMLNELDRLMTSRGLSTRVVFLIYVDLLWPPVNEKIENPDRFILMFAPITRTYSKSFSARKDLPELPPFDLNKLKFPGNVDENVAFLRAWQSHFKGDSFDFDYHLMWDYFKDPALAKSSEIIWQDMKGLADIGINGYVSCQVQRAFFPTGLAMTAMGRTLWNSGLTYEEIADDYYEAAFGADGILVRDYLARLSETFDPVYIRGEKPEVNEESARQFARIPGVVNEFTPVIERNAHSDDACRAKSWFYLRHHAHISRLLGEALASRAAGDKEAAAGLWKELETYLTRNEMELHPALDVLYYIQVLGGLFK